MGVRVDVNGVKFFENSKKTGGGGSGRGSSWGVRVDVKIDLNFL